MKKYNIIKNENETLLEFFNRCCNENGFNVSKLMSYLKYLDEYINDYILQNQGELNEDIVDEILDFGNYFMVNYGEDTRESRFTTFGVNDSTILSIYYDILEGINDLDTEEIYNSFSNLEKRKIDRVIEQFLTLEGFKTFIILDTDEDDEPLEPFMFHHENNMPNEVKQEIKKVLRNIIIEDFDDYGAIICVLSKNPKDLEKGECQNTVFGIRLHNREIDLITSKELLYIFSVQDNVVDEVTNMFVNGEIEFVDADIYINPLGMPRNEYNKLGQKLPNRKISTNITKQDNIVNFKELISKRNKSFPNNPKK